MPLEPLASQTRVIKGRSYTVTQLPAFQGLDLVEQVGVIIGPALGAFAKNGLAGQVDIEAGATRLFSALGKGKLRELTIALLKTTTVELDGGKTPNVLDVFDMLFAGKLTEAFAVMAFAFEVLCGDFFDAARSSLGGFLAAQGPESVSTSQSGSSIAGSP
jgi:hypothetical protein